MIDDKAFDLSASAFFDDVRGSLDIRELAARTVVSLNSRFSHYTWVGIYWLRGGSLELGPWSGPEATEHVSIPLGKGICGSAAASGRIENVPDVGRDGRYLSCFLDTKSEIVVPLSRAGRIIGEIDIDGNEPAAFSSRDERFLSSVARLFDTGKEISPDVQANAERAF